MKIAFIVSTFPKLSETFILNQITGLLDMGYEVTVLAKRKSREKKVHGIVEQYGLMTHTHFFNIPDKPLLFFLKAIVLMMAIFFRNPIEICGLLKKILSQRSEMSLRSLYHVYPFFKTNFDIIHCQFGLNGLIGLSLKRAGVQSRLITSFHGRDLSAVVTEKGDHVYQDLFQEGDLFLTVSEYWKRKLIRMKCNPKKIKVHRMGIDLEEFKYVERKFQPEKNVKLLTIGRLAEKKGHEYAIQAVAQIVRKNKNLNIQYRIAGDGVLRNRLESLVCKLGMENYIKFLGDVEKKAVIALYQQADIFLLSSVTASDGDQEGIPVVLMEALAAGLPVIATDHSGIPELIKDGKTGFLVPEKDISALAKALDYVLENPQEWPVIRRQGRKCVAEKYNIKKQNQELWQIYKSQLDQITH
jgi:colanic acid/amylovoran biosynthesis glycosyltransferase